MNKRQKLDYFDNPALSQSRLKYIGKYKKKITGKEDFALLGNGVDWLRTEKNKFWETFHITKETCPDTIKNLIDKIPVSTEPLEYHRDFIMNELKCIKYKGFGSANIDGTPKRSENSMWDKILKGQKYYDEKRLNLNKTIITEHQYEEMVHCNNVLDHEWLDFIWQQEVSYQDEIFFEYRGHKCKMKTDLIVTVKVPFLNYNIGDVLIVDIKTGSNYQPNRLHLYLRESNIMFQAAWYCLGLGIHLKRPIKDFLVIYCNPKYSYPSWYKMSKLDLQVGRLGGNWSKTQGKWVKATKFPTCVGYDPQLDLYEKHLEQGQWNIPAGLYENKGRL